MSFQKFNIFVSYLIGTFAVFYMLFVGGICCGGVTILDPVSPDTGTAEDCAAACRNLEFLRCPGWDGSPGADESYGTDDDITCLQVCEEIMEELTATLYPKCTAKALSCEEIEACFEGGE